MSNKSEFYKTLESLEKVTKTNLSKQFDNVKDFTESAIHFANRCDLTLAIKDALFAEMSAERLRQDASHKYSDGLITADEYFQIHNESLTLVFDGLIDELKNAIIPACDCKKG